MQCNKSGVAMVPLVEKIPAVYAGIFAVIDGTGGIAVFSAGKYAN